MNNSHINSNELVLHLDGNSSISANTLINIISEMTKIFETVLADENINSPFEIKVTTLKEGSFIIPFVAEAVQFYLQNSNVIANTMQTIKTCFEIKNFLHGKPPISTTNNYNGTTTISNHNAETITVNNYTYNYTIQTDPHITSLSQSILDHSNKGFSISTNNETRQFSPTDVNEMAKPIPELNENKSITLETNLKIIKPVFTGNAMWSFSYNDKIINAKIKDIEFLNKAQNGLVSFNANDSIKVKLRYEYVLSLNKILDNTEKYYIDKVYSHIPAATAYEQLSFED